MNIPGGIMTISTFMCSRLMERLSRLLKAPKSSVALTLAISLSFPFPCSSSSNIQNSKSSWKPSTASLLGLFRLYRDNSKKLYRRVNNSFDSEG